MHPKKVDSNQRAIVLKLRQISGVSVAHTHTLGKGYADILVGFRGKNFWFEIKDGKKVKSQKQLTPDEKEFHSRWNGHIEIAESFEDIMKKIF